MCCTGKEIPYKDYTPKDQLALRQAYNRQAQAGLAGGATPYPGQSAFMTPMNMMYNDAMRAMYTAGGMDPNQWQAPNYMTWDQTQQMFGPATPPPAPQAGMQGMAGGGFMGMRPGMGGFGGGFGGMNQGGPQGQPQSQIPYWLMMPGMGGGMQGSGSPQQ